jgi:hypothetical protein
MQGRKAGRLEGKARTAGRTEVRSRLSTFHSDGGALPALNFCLSAFLLFCLATALPGCVRAQAKVTPDQPLDVPAPPPREVDVADAEPPAPVPLVTEPARNAPARPRPPREPQRTEPARPDPTKPDQPLPAEPPKPPEDVKPPAPPPPPATVLQTTPATAEGEVERAIRLTMTRANADLNRIDYRALNTEARTQYDMAKRFVQQADAALREKNHQFARTLADKAAVIAAQLAGR